MRFKKNGKQGIFFLRFVKQSSQFSKSLHKFWLVIFDYDHASIAVL